MRACGKTCGKMKNCPGGCGGEASGRQAWSGATEKKGCPDGTPLCTCRPCKPGSVPGADSGPLSFIYDGSHLPPPATYPPASDEQPLIAGIHGLATHGTYCRVTSLPPRWALTPPFHPYLPAFPRGTRRAVILCYAPIPSRISSRWLAWRSALPGLSSPGRRPAATGRACAAKVRNRKQNSKPRGGSEDLFHPAEHPVGHVAERRVRPRRG